MTSPGSEAFGAGRIGRRPFPRRPNGVTARAELDQEMQPMLREIEALRSDAERWETPLVVLLVNPVERDGTYSSLQRAYNDVLSEFSHARGICCVDPVSSFADVSKGRTMRLGSDPHWSPAAHDLAAARIVDVLRQSQSVSSAETLPCRGPQTSCSRGDPSRSRSACVRHAVCETPALRLLLRIGDPPDELLGRVDGGPNVEPQSGFREVASVDRPGDRGETK